jgi:hypothetical protein
VAPVVYRESKGFILSGMGVFVVVAGLRAFLFRFNHPDIFSSTLACLAAFYMALLVWVPPKIVISDRGIKGSSFGLTWLDLPWGAVSGIELFVTPVVRVMGREDAVGGRRAIGFHLHPGFKGSIRQGSATYGYDAQVLSMWDMPIETVAQQCVAAWNAHGGQGQLIDQIAASSQPLQLEA